MESPSSSSDADEEDGELIEQSEVPKEVAQEGELDLRQQKEMTWNSGVDGASPPEYQINAEEVSVSQDEKNHSEVATKPAIRDGVGKKRKRREDVEEEDEEEEDDEYSRLSR